VRAAWLAIPWRDLLAALQTPGRIVEGAVLAGAGSAFALLDAEHPASLAAAVLVVHLGAARMLWPLRAELDAPQRARVLLRPRLGRVLLDHTALATSVTAAAALLAAAGCAIAGALPSHGAATATVAVAVTPGLTGCAAMAARRQGRLPSSLLVTAVVADPSGGLGFLSIWFAAWPAIAVVLGAVPLLLVTGRGASGLPVAAAWTAAATAGLAFLVGRDPARD
jgi:hypothetical protein